jgi:hypothetical protein
MLNGVHAATEGSNRSRVTSINVREGSNEEPRRIDVQKIVAAILLAILVIGGLAFYINRPSQKVEDLSQLVRQMRPWCSARDLGDPHVDTSHASLVALAESHPPKWEVAGDSAVASCSQSSKSSKPGTTLVVLTFSSSNAENQWLSNDNTGLYQIIGDNFPLPVWPGLGWVAVLGSNSNKETRDIASLKKVFKVDFRFSQFPSVSW